MITASAHNRHGIACIWALAVLVIVSTLTITGFSLLQHNRKHLEMNHHASQARWLAQSGLEIAIERLSTKPANYQGETLELISKGEVKIVVMAKPDQQLAWTIESTAHYPKGDKVHSVQTIVRNVKATGGPNSRLIFDFSGQ